jgi:hypothetical protein
MRRKADLPQVERSGERLGWDAADQHRNPQLRFE